MLKQQSQQTMIRALPEEYNSFASALLLYAKLDKQTLMDAFIAEEANRKPRSAEASLASANSTSALSSAAITKQCTFCGMSGHVLDTCFAFQTKKREAQAEASERQQKRKNKKGKAKARQAVENAGETAEMESASNVSTSDLLSPLQPDADFD